MSFNLWKTTEFGKVLADWEVTNLGTVITTLTDYHANGSYKRLKENVELMDDENYAIMIRTTNFEQNSFEQRSFKYITKEAYEFLEKSKVYPNDILMNKIANAGSVYLMPRTNKPVSLAMNLFLIRFNEKVINQQFAYYFLKNYESYIKTRASGSVTKTITKDNVRNLEIAYPTLEKQQKIISIIAELEDKIEKNKRMNSVLEQMAQTIFKQWFIDFEFPDENGIPYKSNHGPMKWCNELEKEVPRDWEVVKLGELCNVINGYSYKSNELSNSENAMLTIKSFNRYGGFTEDGYKEIILSQRVKAEHFVDLYDIVVAHTDLTQQAEIIGNPILILTKGKYKKIILSMDTVKVVSYDKEDHFFVFMQMNNSNFKAHALAYTSGTTVLHLSKKAISEYLVVKPASSQLIVQISLIIEDLYRKIALNIKSSEFLINIRDVLLPRLMSGEIEVS